MAAISARPQQGTAFSSRVFDAADGNGSQTFPLSNLPDGPGWLKLERRGTNVFGPSGHRRWVDYIRDHRACVFGWTCGRPRIRYFGFLSGEGIRGAIGRLQSRWCGQFFGYPRDDRHCCIWRLSRTSGLQRCIGLLGYQSVYSDFDRELGLSNDF